MRISGPFSSGVASGGAGVATANADSNHRVSGRVLGVYVKYNDSPPAGTTDVTIKAVGSSPAPPSYNVLAVSNAATDGWFYPRVALCDQDGAALTYDGTRPVHDLLPLDDVLNVEIAQANNGDSVDVWLLLE